MGLAFSLPFVTVDDGTEVIDCVLRHPAPARQESSNTGPTSPKKPKFPVDSVDPPPTPVTTPGYPVRVVGKVARHYESRQIIAETIGKHLLADKHHVLTFMIQNFVLPRLTKRPIGCVLLNFISPSTPSKYHL